MEQIPPGGKGPLGEKLKTRQQQSKRQEEYYRGTARTCSHQESLKKSCTENALEKETLTMGLEEKKAGKGFSK